MGKDSYHIKHLSKTPFSNPASEKKSTGGQNCRILLSLSQLLSVFDWLSIHTMLHLNQNLRLWIVHKTFHLPPVAALTSDYELYLISYFVICKDSWIINHYFWLENFDLASPLLLNQLWSHSLGFHPEILFQTIVKPPTFFRLKLSWRLGSYFLILVGKKKIPDCCQPKHHNTFSWKLIFCKINITTIFHLILSSPAREARQGFADSSVGQNSFLSSLGEDGPKKEEVSELLHASIIPHLEWSFQEEQFPPSQCRVQKKMNEGIDPFRGLISSLPHHFSFSHGTNQGSRSFICHSSQVQRQKRCEWSHHSSISVTITPATHRLHDSLGLKTSLELRL